MLIRLYMLVKHGSNRLDIKVDCLDGEERSFYDLIEPEISLLFGEKFSRLYKEVQEIFTRLGIENDETVDLFSIIAKYKRNFFPIIHYSSDLQLPLQIVGYGIYVAESLISLSCKPNTVPIFNGIEVEMRAIKNIDLEAEDITMSYVDIKLPRDERRANLLKNHLVYCECALCYSGEEEVR